jgi:predicted O-methyltransferase YrrM
MNELDYIQAPASLEPILTRSRAMNFAMASEERTGALLRLLAGSRPSGRLLELGTGTGVGTAWLLAGMDAGSTLVSVDTNAEAHAIARECLGADRRLALITGEGAAFLRSQQPQTYDLVFADAMPGKYEALEEALAVIKPGGFYIIDDMLPQPNWPEGHAGKVPMLLDRLASDDRFLICPMSWASGVVVAVRKQQPSRDNKTQAHGD